MHFFKVCLTHADLFISSLDLGAREIVYTVRDKETGILLEPHFKSKVMVNDSQVTFDHRHIDLNFARFIEKTLK